MELYTNNFNDPYELLNQIYIKNYIASMKKLLKKEELVNRIKFINSYKDLYNFFNYLKKKELIFLKENFLFFLNIILKNINNKKSLYKSLNYLITKDDYFKKEILNFYSYYLSITNNNINFLSYLLENKVDISDKLLIRYLNENKEDLNIFKLLINKTNIINYYDDEEKYNIINYLIKFKKKKYLNYLFFSYQNKSKIKTLLCNINKKQETVFSQEKYYIIKNLNFIKIIKNFNISFEYVLGIDKSLIDELINNITNEINPKAINKYYKILEFIIKKYNISKHILKWQISENIVDELKFLSIQDKNKIYKYKKLINFMAFNNIYFNDKTFFNGMFYYFLMKYTYYPLNKTKILENKNFLNKKHYIEIKKNLINKTKYLLSTNKKEKNFFIKLKILSKNLKIIEEIINTNDKNLLPF